jgi:CheY-like chemotaxis protein
LLRLETKPKIALVVDDSMLIRHTVCRFLEERGFQVEAATNGFEALEILATLEPDIIITDIQMPRMSGVELISAVKNDPRTAEIPIVALSSMQCGAKGPAQDARADFSILKDIDIEAQLESTLAAALGSEY